MSIETFQQRDKLREIYDTFFNPESETCIDFEVFNTLNFYGVISDKEFDKLKVKFIRMSDNTFEVLREFETKQLNKNI